MNKQFLNFFQVYSRAFCHQSTLIILVFGLVFGLVFWQFFIPIFLFSIILTTSKALKKSLQQDFISTVLTQKFSKFEIKNLVQSLTNELNKPYLEQTKINFQNARRELIQIQKNLDLVNSTNSQNEEISKLDLPKFLTEIVEKVINLSLQEQKMRRFLQLEDLPKLNLEIKNLTKKSLQDSTLIQTQNLENNEIVEIIQAKKNQLETIQSCQNKLVQIEDYLEQIQVKLSAIRVLTAKISLQNDNLSSPSDNLLANIERLNLEIDLFEKEMSKTQI